MRIANLFLLSSSLIAFGVCYALTSTVRADTAGDSGTLERANAEMRAVLTKLEELGPKPFYTLTPVEARKQPTPADAVGALLKAQGKDPEMLKKQMGVTTQDVTYAFAAGDQIPARIYTPPGETKDKLPIILYIHGGGWVIADLDTYDASPRAISKKVNAIVVSVHYRQAPESKFPASHDDTNAAYKWVIANAEKWGADSKKIAVVGESAGGNMAISVAIAARDEKLTQPVHIVAIYPVAGTRACRQLGIHKSAEA